MSSVRVQNTESSKYIPSYTSHLDEDIIYIRDGKLLASFNIDGVPFESISDDEIYNLHENLKNAFLSLCKTHKIYIWSHTIKKRMTLENNYKIKNNNFVQSFYNKYIESISNGNFFKTSYNLTIGCPVDDKKNTIDIENSIAKMREIISQVKSLLKVYGLNALGIDSDGSSEIGSHLSFLVNHENYKLPLSSTDLKDSISNSDAFFGFDVFELKNFENEKNIFGVNYLLKDFPRNTFVGQFDFLLKEPIEFVLTNSFLPYSVNKSIKSIDRQLNKLRSTKNHSVLDEEELIVGSQALQSGDTIFGSFHSVLTVFGETVQEAKDNGVKVSGEFVSSGKGFRYVKSTYDSAEAFYSHLPLSKDRPLETTRSIANLACLTSFHNFSYGKEKGNPIGDGTAIMPLKTNSDTLYYFNTHYSHPKKNVTGQKIAGHALILGATGTGKTTTEATACAFLQRFNPCMFVIDYNRSTELFVKAFGGVYFAFKEGAYTGINPFQIGDDDDKELMGFLKSWVKRCAVHSNGSSVTDAEGIMIDNAVDSLMGLAKPLRKFSRLLQTIQKDTDLGQRLSKWCGNGQFAWALDSSENVFNPSEIDKIGFDTTVILEQVNGKDHPACEPLLSVLFFYKNRMQKSGRLMLTIVEEFWKPANFPMTQEMIKSSLKAGRLKGEMIWLTSQSPEDAINCQIFHAIVQQTSTKLCLPNPDASYDGYSQIGLTEKEFRILKSLGRESRMMLIKQSNSSVFAKLDLHGFDDFLPILSGTSEGNAIADKIIEEVGNNPDDWIPLFLDEMKKQGVS